MPGVVIGEGAVVSAGSVVTRSVPPFTMVQGNPAAAGGPMRNRSRPTTTVKEFSRPLQPYFGFRRKAGEASVKSETRNMEATEKDETRGSPSWRP